MIYKGECTKVPDTLGHIFKDLQQRYPDADAELYFRKSGAERPKQVKGPLGRVAVRFRQLCSGVPSAWICYNPDHPYGLVLKIDLHGCPAAEDYEQSCNSFTDTPWTLLVLSRVGSHAVLIGSDVVPHAM